MIKLIKTIALFFLSILILVYVSSCQSFESSLGQGLDKLIEKKVSEIEGKLTCEEKNFFKNWMIDDNTSKGSMNWMDDKFSEYRKLYPFDQLTFQSIVVHFLQPSEKETSIYPPGTMFSNIDYKQNKIDDGIKDAIYGNYTACMILGRTYENDYTYPKIEINFIGFLSNIKDNKERVFHIRGVYEWAQGSWCVIELQETLL